MSAALLQGARGATDNIDLWFQNIADPQIGQAARSVGGIWISGSFGLGPPRLGGEPLGDRFGVVTHLSGLGSFPEEFAHVRYETLEGVSLPLLALERIAVSKRAAGRPKDLAQLHVLEEVLAGQKAGIRLARTG